MLCCCSGDRAKYCVRYNRWEVMLLPIIILTNIKHNVTRCQGQIGNFVPVFCGAGNLVRQAGVFRAPARVPFGRSPKSDQKVCLKPKVSRLPARYTLFPIVGLYRTVTELFICRADKRTVSASAPLPLISATVEPIAPAFQSKSGSEKRSRDDAIFR